MPDIPHLLLAIFKGLFRLIDGLMTIFHVVHEAQNQMTTHSRVGEAPIERENREWRERILDYWHWITLALCLTGLVAWWLI